MGITMVLADFGTTAWIGIILIVLGLFLIVLYNGLVQSRNQVRNAYSQIDVQLKRRYDLIPNLVETVKGYAKHEQETLENVVRARQAGISASGVAAQAAAENALTGALRQLFALSEAYPDLKANQNFSQLQEELASTENKIGFARQHYNNTVENYNNKIQSFPGVLVAGVFGFAQEEYFEIEDPSHREAVRVKF
ncbi:MAG: LemA protein [Phycisphaerae bacterium]